MNWWRGQDLNLRPSGYEPDELPGCSTPRRSRSITVQGPPVTHNRQGKQASMFSSSRKTRLAVEALSAQVAELRAIVAEQAARIDAEQAHNDHVAERLGEIEARITGMGAELSRQVHELGTDIENLSRRADDDSTRTAVDALRTAQIRLATEQARYEITFRQDLAELADRVLRRTR